MNIKHITSIHEFQLKHYKNKLLLDAFVKNHFAGNFGFDIESTLYFFISGRYEFKNKGYDLFLEAINRLNMALKNENSQSNIIVFIITKAKTNGYNKETLQRHSISRQLKECIAKISQKIEEQLFNDAIFNQLTESEKLISLSDQISIKKYIQAFKTLQHSSIVTHNMLNDHSDPILIKIRNMGLYNDPLDKIKVIYHPDFISQDNPILNLEYGDFITGCHLGIFPSYYEPWGYTPAECTACGTPSITTNLSGFGCYIQEHVKNSEDHGVYIIDRNNLNRDESINQLVEYMLSFSKQSHGQRIAQRNRTERLSHIFSWENLITEYETARNLAVKRKFKE